MLRLDECSDRPDAGRKAQRLAQARARGLPVLDGWVVLPGESVGDVSSLGQKVIVRSSSPVEDGERSAAGGFLSLANIPIGEVAAAGEQVGASAEGEAARAYFGSSVAMPVLIQPMAKQPKLAVAMTHQDGFLVEERNAGEPEWGEVEARQIVAGPIFA